MFSVFPAVFALCSFSVFSSISFSSSSSVFITLSSYVVGISFFSIGTVSDTSSEVAIAN
jgi:hypothetical protein